MRCCKGKNGKIIKVAGCSPIREGVLLDIVIMSSQFGSAEVGIYPLFVVDGEFGNDIDSGFPDVTHIFGSPSVVRLA